MCQDSLACSEWEQAHRRQTASEQRWSDCSLCGAAAFHSPCGRAGEGNGVELPSVNEDLRNFFLPRKQVAPEPEPAPEPAPEVSRAPARQPGQATPQGTLVYTPVLPHTLTARNPPSQQGHVDCLVLQAKKEDAAEAVPPISSGEDASHQVAPARCHKPPPLQHANAQRMRAQRPSRTARSGCTQAFQACKQHPARLRTMDGRPCTCRDCSVGPPLRVAQELKTLQALQTQPGPLKRAAQAPQPRSPSSAYRPGAFDAAGPNAHAAEPKQASRGWFGFGKPTKTSSRWAAKKGWRVSTRCCQGGHGAGVMSCRLAAHPGQLLTPPPPLLALAQAVEGGQDGQPLLVLRKPARRAGLRACPGRGAAALLPQACHGAGPLGPPAAPPRRP